MNEPINIILLMMLIAIGVAALALSQSPDALERLGMKMRARAAALRAAKLAWAEAYNLSLYDQERAEAERRELRAVMEEAKR